MFGRVLKRSMFHFFPRCTTRGSSRFEWLLGRMTSVVSPGERVRSECVPAMESGRARVWSRATMSDGVRRRVCADAREARLRKRPRTGRARSQYRGDPRVRSVRRLLVDVAHRSRVPGEKGDSRWTRRTARRRETWEPSPALRDQIRARRHRRRRGASSAGRPESTSLERSAGKRREIERKVTPSHLCRSILPLPPARRVSQYEISTPWRCLCDIYIRIYVREVFSRVSLPTLPSPRASPESAEKGVADGGWERDVEGVGKVKRLRRVMVRVAKLAIPISRQREGLILSRCTRLVRNVSKNIARYSYHCAIPCDLWFLEFGRRSLSTTERAPYSLWNGRSRTSNLSHIPSVYIDLFTSSWNSIGWGRHFRKVPLKTRRVFRADTSDGRKWLALKANLFSGNACAFSLSRE